MVTSSSPRPASSAPATPSTPAGSTIRRPSIWKPPQIPSTGRPAAAWSRTARSSPRERSQARSASVARVPGSTTRSAPASARGVGGEDDVDARLDAERVDVGEVGDPREPYDGDPQPRLVLGWPADRRRSSASSESSQRSGCHGSTPYTSRPVSAAELVESRAEQVDVAAELVDHEARDQRLVRRVQQRHRAEHRREDAAAVDVADHDRRDRAVLRQPHVDVVAGPQVDLRRAARALDDDEVVAGGEVVEGGVRRVAQVGAAADEVLRVDRAAGSAHHHDVAAPVAAGLEEHRVHRGLGLDSGRDRLDPLGAADLDAAAVGGGADHRVVGHVLRLEGRDPHATSGVRPAQRGRHDRLAGVRRRPGDQQRAHGVSLGGLDTLAGARYSTTEEGRPHLLDRRGGQTPPPRPPRKADPTSSTTEEGRPHILDHRGGQTIPSPVE